METNKIARLKFKFLDNKLNLSFILNECYINDTILIIKGEML